MLRFGCPLAIGFALLLVAPAEAQPQLVPVPEIGSTGAPSNTNWNELQTSNNVSLTATYDYSRAGRRQVRGGALLMVLGPAVGAALFVPPLRTFMDCSGSLEGWCKGLMVSPMVVGSAIAVLSIGAGSFLIHRGRVNLKSAAEVPSLSLRFSGTGLNMSIEF